MRENSGQLPVDFLVGFTIFILSLIMVANFVPSLLVGLQRTTGIDYNAVAYRTGVVLVEDPGQPSRWDNDPLLSKDLGYMIVAPLNPPWDQQTRDQQTANPTRFGLALTRDTPNILSIDKIERFFNTSFYRDADYRNKLLFSSYPYGYNVTLQSISPMDPGQYPNGLVRMLGEPYPAGYGYIRRYVVIKQDSNATIDLALRPEFNAANEADVNLVTHNNPLETDPHQEFTIRLDGSVLYNKSIDAPFTIDLQNEPIRVRIDNLQFVLNNSALNTGSPLANSTDQWDDIGDALDPSIADAWCPTNQLADRCIAPTSATLVEVQFWNTYYGKMIPSLFQVNLSVDDGWASHRYVDWTSRINAGVHADDFDPPVQVYHSIALNVSPLRPEAINSDNTLDIVFKFRDGTDGYALPHTLLKGTYLYDYNRTNVTQPVLSTGMLEVGVW
ncbi:MAG TPA: hypothetical protein VKO45_07190 [Methanomicrobiales archaeon]|nr:hypothetical protein [Methanomicrobiales archaeon]